MPRTLSLQPLRTVLAHLLAIAALSFVAQAALSDVGTTVPISASLATGIAADLFPVTAKLSSGNVFLTQPVALFLDDGRVGMQVRIQAYDHRPAEGIAVSEMGRAVISGTLGFDPATRQILLGTPRIEQLEFEQDNESTRGFLKDMHNAWTAQVSNPIRADIPPHPYVVLFRNNIRDISYDGKNIILTLSYEQEPVGGILPDFQSTAAPR